ncbi:unnamed protein product [Auanema sp. JU1783]|nr:unnamed protein product [Auanema sp. JU1783]
MEIKCCLCLEGTRIIFEDESGNDPASTYKMCQGLVHVKRACFYVGVSAIVLCIFSAICMVFGVYSVNFWLDVVLILLNLIVSIILMIGLYYDSANLLIPFIVSEISQCVGFFVLATYTLYYTFTFKRQRFYQKFDQMLMVISIYLGIIVCASAVWAAAKCYHYLRDKSNHNIPESRSMWR